MLKFHSDPRNVCMVESYLKRIVEKYRLSPDVYGNILISLTEAVNNAIIHGNCEDESKLVKIHLQKEKDRLAIRVSDEGCGFDFSNLPDPTSPENLTKIGGRGVFLMHQLSDDVKFQDNGRTVEMRFKI